MEKEYRSLPSPEELFPDPAHEKPAGESARIRAERLRRRKTPRFRIKSHQGIWFSVFLLALILLFLNLDRLNIQTYTMLSGSMEQRIPAGSLIIERKVPPKTLKVGDIVTFRNAEGLSVTHEIVKVYPVPEGDPVCRFRTKGTENKFMDEEILEEDQILGKVVFSIPYLGRLFSR